MGFGSTSPKTEIASAVYSGMIAIAERSLHEYDTGTGKHSWETDDAGDQVWVEDPYFRPTRVTWNSDEKPNFAEIMMENTRVEDWQDNLNPADQIRVVLLSEETTINDDGESELATQRRIIFRGFPATVLASASDNTEGITVGCMGWRYYANRIMCSRQTVYGVDPSQTPNDLVTDLPLIFNEGGRMNRATTRGDNPDKPGRASDDDSYLFTWPALEKYSTEWEGHDFWTVGYALEYLFARFKDPDATITLYTTMPETVLKELAAIQLPEVDVEGLFLAEAISKIMQSVGYHWGIVPSAKTGEWLFKTWKPGTRVGTADVHFPAVASNLSAMKVAQQTNRFDISYDYRNIVNEYMGIGSLKRYENDWSLQKAWDSDKESENDEYYYRSGKNATANPDWEAYRNVWRRWAIDGAGLITSTYKNFTDLLGTHYFQRPRYLDDQVLTPEDNDEGIRKPAEIFLHHDGSWKRMDGNVDIFSEGLADGIYLDGKQITVDGGTEGEALVDVMKDVDEVEVIAAVEADLAINETKSDTASKADYLTRQKALRLPDFKYEKRWANDRDNSTEVLRDDTTKMQEFLDQKLEATKDPVMSVSITTPLLYYNLTPGTTIRKISGRDITIGAEIVAVDFMLDSEQSMQLSLADTRMRRFT